MESTNHPAKKFFPLFTYNLCKINIHLAFKKKTEKDRIPTKKYSTFPSILFYPLPYLKSISTIIILHLSSSSFHIFQLLKTIYFEKKLFLFSSLSLQFFRHIYHFIFNLPFFLFLNVYKVQLNECPLHFEQNNFFI